jgi:hypothetical protein
MIQRSLRDLSFSEGSAEINNFVAFLSSFDIFSEDRGIRGNEMVKEPTTWDS